MNMLVFVTSGPPSDSSLRPLFGGNGGGDGAAGVCQLLEAEIPGFFFYKTLLHHELDYLAVCGMLCVIQHW